MTVGLPAMDFHSCINAMAPTTSFDLKIKDSPEIVDFIQSDEYERLISITLKDRAYRTLRDLGLNPVWKIDMTARLVRFDLPNNGEVEVLMTNLMDRKRFHYKRIGQLYGWRWGVETAIANLKSFLQLALTSAYTQPGVEQDLWSTCCFYNINSAFAFAAEQEVEAKTAHRKYSYQINRNMAAGLIKRWLPHLFISSESCWRAKTKVLKEILLMHLEPYRPRTSRERKRRNYAGSRSTHLRTQLQIKHVNNQQGRRPLYLVQHGWARNSISLKIRPFEKP